VIAVIPRAEALFKDQLLKSGKGYEDHECTRLGAWQEPEEVPQSFVSVNEELLNAVKAKGINLSSFLNLIYQNCSIPKIRHAGGILHEFTGKNYLNELFRRLLILFRDNHTVI
jgi:hypothetical protein